jgi:DNA-binding transcriptional ArsR family regulator
MTMTAAPAEVDLTSTVCLFRGLADPTRLAIVRHLALGEHRVVDLTAHLGLAQSTVSGHLSCLRDCGLVSVRAEGRASVYRLARPEVLDLLAAAEQFLAVTGTRWRCARRTAAPPAHELRHEPAHEPDA